MIAKMNKTEISAEILKREKIKVFIIGITPKTNQHMCRVRSCLLTKVETNPGRNSSSREQHRILAVILDFAEEAEKRHKKLPGKFLRANMHTANI